MAPALLCVVLLTTGPASAGPRNGLTAQAEPGVKPQEAAPEAKQPGNAATAGENTPGRTPGPNGNPEYRIPEIRRDLSILPFAARRMHELLVEAARSGDIEKLRPYIGSGDDVTLLSFGGFEGDPIDFLKSLSGDGEGHEILAILLEVLEAGFVHVEEGTPNEMYVWPYFYAVPADNLTPPQRVELFELLTYGDYEEMKAFGAYFFYRTGITPQGRWRFFVAGD